jgi:type II secretory pathway pseudopilin PulG
MPTGESVTPAARRRHGGDGYVMLLLMIAVAVLSVLMLMAVPLWQTVAQREAEEELIFRARQYVTAIELYVKSHNNLYPQNFEILHLEKFLRQLYPDPLSDDGVWDMVFQDASSGEAKYLVVPAHMAKAYFSRAQLVGVCSTSTRTAFREYRGMEKYNEWAFYVGEKETEKMPDLRYEGVAP